MPNIWRVKLGGLIRGDVPTWNVYCGKELIGIEFESYDEADDFVREHLSEGWTSDWPTIPGWYWFWDPSFPDIVEPGRLRLFGNGILYSRSSEEIREDGYSDCRWHAMDKPPVAPMGVEG